MRCFGIILVSLILAGCAGYKLGPTNGIPAGSRSVAIRPFVNKTPEPNISEYLAISMRRQLQQDGTYRLETHGNPDISVGGEITRFERSGLSYTTNDVLTPQEYTLTLTARVVARNMTTGRTNFDREIIGRTFIRIGQDLGSSERQAIPLLTEELARNAINALADGSW